MTNKNDSETKEALILEPRTLVHMQTWYKLHLLITI